MQFLQRNISIQIKRGSALLIVLYFLAVLYAVWEMFWYTKVGWAFVHWHTHLSPYCFLLLFIYTIAWWQQRFGNGWMALSSVILSLMLVEIVLMLFPANQSRDFVNQFVFDPQNPYHIWQPQHPYHLASEDEFSYSQTANSLGFFGKEWIEEKDTGTVRIITLGDSFTEGFGTTTDSSYPACLQQILGGKFEVLNAGTCGSDPVFNFKNLQDRLLKYKPDWVIQTISSHDMLHDLAIRGGFERYKSNGDIAWYMPLWLYVAQISHLTAMVMSHVGINENMPYGPHGGNRGRLDTIIKDLVKHYDSLATTGRFRVLFVILPMRNEVKDNSLNYNLQPLEESISKTQSLRCVSLMTSYQNHIKDSKQPYSSFYYSKDAHHNASGYKLMADCVAEKLLPYLTVSSR